MKEITEQLLLLGLTKEKYEAILKDCCDKLEDLNDYSWEDICKKYGLDINPDSLRKAQSMAPFGGAFVRQYYMNNSSESTEEQIRALEKARIKYRDERNAYNAIIRDESRKESFIELVERTLKKEVKTFEPTPSVKVNGDRDMIVCLTDPHAGINIKNFVNTYNTDILLERLDKYLSEITNIQKENKCKECIVWLGGDLISGWIHRNLRLQNNENVIEQIKFVSENIAKFVNELSKLFESVRVYSVSGNHSRLSPNKEEQLKGEELDALVPYYLKLKFADHKNVSVLDNNIDSTFCIIETRAGYIFFGVHGDKDTPATVIPNLTLMTSIIPDGVLTAHCHYNSMSYVHGIPVIQSGTLEGTDDYCIDRRLSGKPQQAVIISDSNQAVRCIYNIEF